jgi:hypothetical protein
VSWLVGQRSHWFGLASAGTLGALVVWWCVLHAYGWHDYGVEVGSAGIDGERVVLSLVRVVAIDGPQGFDVEKGSDTVRVLGPSSGMAVGDELSVGGVWRVEAHAVESAWIEQHTEGRRAKRLLGGLGMLMAMGAWLWVVGGRPGSWRLRG